MSLHVRQLSSARKQSISNLTPIHEEGDTRDTEYLGHHNSTPNFWLPSSLTVEKATLHQSSPSKGRQALTRSSSIAHLVRATDLRRGDPDLSPIVHSSTSASSASLKQATMISSPLGSSECRICARRPTHKLIPCQHGVCYDHLLVGYDSESEVSSLCARCRQVISVQFT